jgi:hypothetical protein
VVLMYDTPTQLEDVSNQVSQQKIGDNRLRNEEIRRQMGNEWSPKSVSAGAQPSSLQDIFSNNGNSPTEASTYSRLKNNVDYLGFGNSTSSSNSNNTPSTGSSWSGIGDIPASAPGYLGAAMGMAGYGQAAGPASAGLSLLRGDTGNALGTAAQWAANQTPIGQYPGAAGAVGSTIRGIYEGKSPEAMAKNAAWNVGMGILGKTIPGFGVANGALSLGTSIFGALTGKDMSWNPQRGLENLFGDGLAGVAPGMAGYGNGFFGPNATGQGISTTGTSYTNPNQSLYSQSPAPVVNGSNGYTPPNYSLGQGVSLGGYSPSDNNSGDS